MDDMIGRVARATHAEFASTMPTLFWKHSKPVWEAVARAAIEAMREPTEAMKEAVERTTGAADDAGVEGSVSFPVAYRAMIDEALK